VIVLPASSTRALPGEDYVDARRVFLQICAEIAQFLQ
jgi:hypothetical protein